MTFDYARFTSSDFSEATLAYATYHYTEIVSCIFTAASLYTSQLNHATLQGNRFHRADLRRCWFTDTVVRSCDFDEANLEMSNFVRASVRASSFRNARMHEIQLDHARFEGCEFVGASIDDHARRTVFEDCDFRGANLDKLRLKDTRFVRCRFARVIGTPIIEGSYEIVDPSFEDDAPFEGPHSADELRRAWGDKVTQP